MQTARIIPYMERKTAVEAKRRAALAFSAARFWFLLPFYLAESIWLTMTGQGDEE